MKVFFFCAKEFNNATPKVVLLTLLTPYAQLVDSLVGILSLSLVRTNFYLRCALALAMARSRSRAKTRNN